MNGRKMTILFALIMVAVTLSFVIGTPAASSSKYVIQNSAGIDIGIVEETDQLDPVAGIQFLTNLFAYSGSLNDDAGQILNYFGNKYPYENNKSLDSSGANFGLPVSNYIVASFDNVTQINFAFSIIQYVNPTSGANATTLTKRYYHIYYANLDIENLGLAVNASTTVYDVYFYSTDTGVMQTGTATITKLHTSNMDVYRLTNFSALNTLTNSLITIPENTLTYPAA